MAEYDDLREAGEEVILWYYEHTHDGVDGVPVEIRQLEECLAGTTNPYEVGQWVHQFLLGPQGSEHSGGQPESASEQRGPTPGRVEP